jgi:TolB-like protein
MSGQLSTPEVQVKKWPTAVFAGLYFSLLIAIFSWTGMAAAQSIAFFPLLDLSKDPNGINSSLTEKVQQELIIRGKTLIPAEEIMRFLVSNRIRSLGKLSSYQTSLVRKELGADLVLQGTVCQVDDGKAPLLSLNLQLSRTSDKQIIWARTEHLYYSNLTSLLSLHDPHNLEDLYEPFFNTLFATLPEHPDIGSEAINTLNIDTVIISPNYLRSGENVTCKIKMHNILDEKAIQPQITVRSNGQEHPLFLDKEGDYLQKSWQVEDNAGSYPITLKATWPSGNTQEGIIGSYNVDAQEPGVKLHLIGTELDEEILFSHKLIIIPKLLEPEPIDRWEIRVTDEEEKAIVIMGAAGNIPRRITWQGKTSIGGMADPGIYWITFKVWDRAQRESYAEAEVQYRPEPPQILVEVTQEEDRVRVDLDNSVNTPLNFWWVKFYGDDGSLLKLAQGTELPVTIELDNSSDPEYKIQCLLTARDILGNQSQLNIADLFKPAESGADEDEISIETEWLEEF